MEITTICTGVTRSRTSTITTREREALQRSHPVGGLGVFLYRGFPMLAA